MSVPTLAFYSGSATTVDGYALAGATVIVLLGTTGGTQAVNTATQPGTPLATIYSDPYAQNVINQTTAPLVTDGQGNYGFWAVAGYYVLQIYGNGIYQVVNGTVVSQYVQGISIGGANVVSAIQFTIDGGGLVPVTGSWGQIQIPYPCTITSATLTADQPGAAVVDLKLCTYAGFPGSLASITASAKPTLAVSPAQQKYTDSTLTGWTTSLAAGDLLQVYLVSVSTCTRLNLTLVLSVA